MRDRGVGFGRAVGVSVAVHAALVTLAYVLIGHSPPAPPPARTAGIDARPLPPVGTQPDPGPRIRLPADVPSPAAPTTPPPSAPSPPTGSRPEVVHVPATL